MTMLYRSTDRLCRRGAPMKNLAHSASLDSEDKDAPSKSGIKHLVWARSRRAHRAWAHLLMYCALMDRGIAAAAAMDMVAKNYSLTLAQVGSVEALLLVASRRSSPRALRVRALEELNAPAAILIFLNPRWSTLGPDRMISGIDRIAALSMRGDAGSEIPCVSDIQDAINQAREAVSGGPRGRDIRQMHAECRHVIDL